ncbi:hypothetical protein TVAG_145130 [Trichomonas vaginalis G3]|uniref:Surface antigen BspA-like n=1 Tax=Trichomonas vaginalis (strain ATCC PRA-98 / G3) TaxID=412133 RepID=A2GB08_TRIV3|nr:ribonuclease inhibitor domain-containing protein [Trichomonas vaginalis G3]EAX85659.1 hypothetical protein TVAG_145130 [Trichomonas vaginalis G3]KAI5498761.1 ribonuclease inhibitor domain-containing protein [Trichomonas vaginalis G3]|eukprot:XP_001298589.1 hypothetical protein [Trichomonas vaginalis G3]
MLTALTFENIQHEIYSVTDILQYDTGKSLVIVNCFNNLYSFKVFQTITHKGIQNMEIKDPESYIPGRYFFKYRNIKKLIFSEITSTPSIQRFSEMFPNIEEIDFDDNVQTIKTIFAYSNFKKVQLNKVFHISSYCFYGCKNLQSINLLLCSTIDEFAFCNSGLAGKIELGSVSIR